MAHSRHCLVAAAAQGMAAGWRDGHASGSQASHRPHRAREASLGGVARLPDPAERDLWGPPPAWSGFAPQGARTLLSVYPDTSFLVSHYLPDRYSEQAQRLMASRPVLSQTPLHVAEWSHAVEQHVIWKVMTRDEADRLHALFQDHRSRGLFVEEALPANVLDLCARLARLHAGRLGLRTLDTLHVASALLLKADAFYTFDNKQWKLARAESLKAPKLRSRKA